MKRVLLLTALLCLTLIFCAGSAAFAEGVTYLDANGETQTCTDYTLLTEEITSLDTKWYVVSGSVSYDNNRLEVNGEAHLILCDNAILYADRGITVSSNKSLTIYAQSTGSSMGKLEAGHVGNRNAGIGGTSGHAGGMVTINGGSITASSGDEGAGIGGGSGGACGTVIINGGTVTASSGYGAGIGSGSYSGEGTVTINGGKVTASSTYGAGIGGSYDSSYIGSVSINGGTIEAISDDGAGIGCGKDSSMEGTVSITGGTVKAKSTNGAGIGCGKDSYMEGTVSISGGTVAASSDNAAGIGGVGNRTDTGTLTVSFADSDASLTASSYGGTVTVAEGRILTDGSAFYAGTLSDAEKADIQNKTLVKNDTAKIIRVNAAEHGTVIPSASAAEHDTIITLDIIPAEGFVLDRLTVTWVDGETTKTVETTQGTGENANKYTFTMPAGDASVEATFKAIYSITLSANANGSVTASVGVTAVASGGMVAEGDTVTLTVTPDDGYALKMDSLIAAYLHPDGYPWFAYLTQGTGDNANKYTFEMPAADVTVTAEFGKDLALCTATVPNPMYNDGYFIGYFYDGSWNENHGGIQVTDPDGNTLTYYHYDEDSGEMVGDYIYSTIETLDGYKYDEDPCTHVGEKCCVTLEGCGDWAGTLTADIVILSPTGSGDWGNLTWSFADGTLSIDAKKGAVTPVTMNAADSCRDYPWCDYSSSTTAINIGEGVASVADWAFGGTQNENPYSSVTAVTLSSTLTDIGERAFAYMGSLETVDLSHVLTIGDYAFSQCASLAVSVPATVTVIGSAAFDGCQSVTAPAFGTPTFILPDDAVSVGEAAFENDTSITVVDASGCSSIGPDAFKGCTGLRRIRLPKDCDINSTAFVGCGTVFVYAPSGGTTEDSCEKNNNCIFVEENPRA